MHTRIKVPPQSLINCLEHGTASQTLSESQISPKKLKRSTTPSREINYEGLNVHDIKASHSKMQQKKQNCILLLWLNICKGAIPQIRGCTVRTCAGHHFDCAKKGLAMLEIHHFSTKFVRNNINECQFRDDTLKIKTHGSPKDIRASGKNKTCTKE